MHSSFSKFQLTQCLALGLGAALAGCGSPIESGSDMDKRPSRPEEVSQTQNILANFYTVDQYGDDRSAEDDLKMTMARAAKEKKRILLQVGGEWCGWCKRLTAFIESTEPVRASLETNYLLMKVTYTQAQPNEAFLSKYPKIKGYPHLFVLDAEGKLLHSQDTGVLEEGNGYNETKVVEFLEKWKPTKD